MMAETKKCFRCHDVKLMEEFSAGRDKYGKHSWCKQCCSHYGKALAAANRVVNAEIAKRTDYHRDYYRANADKIRPRAAITKQINRSFKRMATTGNGRDPLWLVEIRAKLKQQAEQARRPL